ncbi:MAG: OmpA family protein [Myxococcota bacterium]|jgi:outer membrane protein OmpA-like peptidoglycan-associated protein|nr:OmpA family protein [Myxococcota bacterium]
MLTILAWLLGGVVFAQDTQDDTLDIELFNPHPDTYGYFHVPSATTLGHMQVGVGLWTNYSNDPLVLIYDAERVVPQNAEVIGDDGDGVIDDRLVSNVQVGMGVSRFFSLVVDTPLILWQDGYTLDNLDKALVEPEALIAAGIGDVRVTPKLVALDRDRVPIGMAFAMTLGLPTGNGGSFMGEEDFWVVPQMITEFSDGSIRARRYRIRGALHGGYRVRTPGRIRDVRVGNEVVYGAAIGLHPVDVLELVGEYHGSISGPRTAQHPSEALFGLKFLFGRYVTLNLSGGMGILPGVGAPDYRVAGGVTLAPSFDPNARDADKDGIVDGMDQCVREPEDVDRYRDEDGCPDPDNDIDGIPDTQDQCPDDPEDDDGWMDNDGCPDHDNDKDGILDIADRCPNEAEDLNGIEDEDGCPETGSEDTDGDGYSDDVDRCPYDPEDFDDFLDEDGCPDSDNDNDGILDMDDHCPNIREIHNGVDDDDGCPDEGRVVVEESRIRIDEVIFFDFAKATIQERSFDLLDEIASVVLSHTDLRKIRIEGHTDNVGGDAVNLKLSQARAESVRVALVERGVENLRLDARGFGEMYPIDSNDTDEGRANNRRVEFIIVERD